MIATGPDSLARQFEGEALQYMQTQAQPASEALKNDLSELMRNSKEPGNCRAGGDGNQAYIADIDGDGTPEGLSIYTLGNCDSPTNALRILAVLRQDDSGRWQPVLRTALNVLADEPIRPILQIGKGTITVAGELDPGGNRMPPEVIEVPVAEQPPPA